MPHCMPTRLKSCPLPIVLPVTVLPWLAIVSWVSSRRSSRQWPILLLLHLSMSALRSLLGWLWLQFCSRSSHMASEVRRERLGEREWNSRGDCLLDLYDYREFASKWALLSFSLLCAAPVIFLKIKNHITVWKICLPRTRPLPMCCPPVTQRSKLLFRGHSTTI